MASPALAAAGAPARPAGGGSPAPDALAADQVPGTLVLVALTSSGLSQEAVGLQALAALQGLDGALWEAHAMALVHLGRPSATARRSTVSAGASPTTPSASTSMRPPSTCGSSGADAMATSLRYVADLVAGGQVTQLAVVSAWCAAYSLAAEALNPAAAPEILQRLVALTLAHRVTQPTSPEEIGLLLAAAKGRRFSALIGRGTLGWVPTGRPPRPSTGSGRPSRGWRPTVRCSSRRPGRTRSTATTW